jgi:hypothetical protein
VGLDCDGDFAVTTHVASPDRRLIDCLCFVTTPTFHNLVPVFPWPFLLDAKEKAAGHQARD